MKPHKRDLAIKMRFNPTLAEEVLWQELSNEKTGYKFRRQALMLGYIVDFYCPKLSLVIEVDGEIHDNNKEYDRERDSAISSLGLKVVRFKNYQVLSNAQKMVKQILQMGDITGKRATPI